MYTEQDLKAVDSQISKRLRWIGAAVLLLLAVLVFTWVIRMEVLSMVAGGLTAAVIIFCYDLLLKPLRCYRRHLNNCLHGRTRTLDAAFGEMDEEVSLVDGVRYYPMTAIIQDEKGRDTDRLFYYDCELPRPGWVKGQMLHIVFHDRELVDVQPIG